ITLAVQRADTGVAAPGEDQLLRAASADHLVVDQVRGHADQGQIPLALADDLVAGSEGNQVGEAFQRNGVAIIDEGVHRVLQREKFSHHMSPVATSFCSHYELMFYMRTS